MRHYLSLTCILTVIAWTASPLSAASLASIAPPGPYFPLARAAHERAETFAMGKPVIGTTYFYWYDVYSGAHTRDPDGTDALTTHPPKLAMVDLSYKSPAWHYTQLRDMASAGIDFMMPVYWGMPGDDNQWSVVGVPPLVEAHDRMLAEHKTDASHPLPPQIGMFYDTSTLRWPEHKVNDLGLVKPIDLTTKQGREWFYVTIRDFFSMIPPDKWARIERRPIVFLYGNFAADVDDKLFDDARKRFESDFGIGLFLVRHVDWPGSADAWYRWGGSIKLTIGDQVAGLGPGYDDSAVPGREPRVVDRQQGKFYKSQWEKLLRMAPARRPWIVHIETWNEWHEGTDIARSDEYGNHYITATTKYAKMFHAKVRLQKSGPFANADRVRWSGRSLSGLDLRPSKDDGLWTYLEVDGVRAAVTIGGKTKDPYCYLYFDVDDSYAYGEMNRDAKATITFRDDGGCNAFRIQYDNDDPHIGPLFGAFRDSRRVAVGNTGTWRTVEVHLPNVRFCNRANGADLRLAVEGGARSLTVREVIVRLLPGTALP